LGIEANGLCESGEKKKKKKKKKKRKKKKKKKEKKKGQQATQSKRPCVTTHIFRSPVEDDFLQTVEGPAHNEKDVGCVNLNEITPRVLPTTLLWHIDLFKEHVKEMRYTDIHLRVLQ